MKRLSSIGWMILALSGFAAAQKDFHDSADVKQVNTRPQIFEKVGIDQKLGSQVPLGANFVDENGKSVTLDAYFHTKRPVLLALVYYDCPMLCNQVLNGMTSALGVLKFNAGQEFDVVAVSFDPRESAKLANEKRAVYLKRYRRESAATGWHFLTGSEDSIKALTSSVGFRYTWDESTKQFAHASGLILLTPEGKVAQYYYGIEYSPRDLRLGMIEASQEKIGTVVDQLMLYCFHYDPMTGKYGAVIMNVLRVSAVFTLLLIGGFVFASVKRERQGASA